MTDVLEVIHRQPSYPRRIGTHGTRARLSSAQIIP
jgi:hypothetical protein